MKDHAVAEARTTTKQAAPKLIRPESHLDRLTRLQEAIACRAYELFESRRREHGQDCADWLRAESELLQPLPIQVREQEDRLAVEAQMPGFSAEQIEVSAEPRRLIISGRSSLTDQEKAENTFSREVLAKEAFRLLDLPVEVDAGKVEATFSDGVLNVTLPKRVPGKPAHAQA
ncbi:MAG TPA: Hsp20 family protein [Blastocatellia bacterium]|nr:Hsp20 family protein [Blastocatellia bacterium]